jgi:hypothetical protein
MFLFASNVMPGNFWLRVFAGYVTDSHGYKPYMPYMNGMSHRFVWAMNHSI